LDNVNNINDDTSKKGDVMSGNKLQVEDYKSVLEDIDMQLWYIDQYAFHMQEMLKTLEIIGHKVDEHQMGLLREIYKYYGKSGKRYKAFEEFFTNVTIDEVANFDMSFWSYAHLYDLSNRLHDETVNGTAAHLFTLKLYGELVKRLSKHFVHFFCEWLPTPHDVNEKVLFNHDYGDLLPIDIDDLSEDLLIAKDDIMHMLEFAEKKVNEGNCEDSWVTGASLLHRTKAQ